MGSKGSMLDLFKIMIVAVVIMILVLMATYIKDATFPQLQSLLGNDVQAVNVMNTMDRAFGIFDYLFMFVVIMMGMSSIIMAYFVKQHPLFLFVEIIMLIILVVLAPAFSNMARQFWETSQFAPYSASGGGSVTYPIMTYMMRYLPIFLGVLGLVLAVVSFAKPDVGG